MDFKSKFQTRVLQGLTAVTLATTLNAGTAWADISLVYGPDTIATDGVTQATYTILNDTGGGVTDIGFNHTFTGDLVGVGSGDVSTTCPGGVVSFDGGLAGLTLTDAALANNESCTVTALLTNPTAEAISSSTGTVTSSGGSLGTATDTVTFDAARPLFTKTLSPATVDFGGVTTMEYTLDNSAFGSTISVSLSEDLPTGFTVASPSNAANSCFTGTTTAVAGGSSIVFSGGFVLANTSCTITVDIVAETSGDTSLTSNEISYFTGASFSGGYATAVASVTAPETSVPDLIKRFTEDNVAAGSTVELVFSMTNYSRDENATNITFTDDLDAMLTGSTLNADLSDICGSGSSITGAGTGTLTFAGGSLAAGASCEFAVNVDLGTDVAGTYTNTTSTVNADMDGNLTLGDQVATDAITLTDTPAPIISMTATDAIAGGTTSLSIDLTNPAASTMTAVGFTLEFEDVLSADVSMTSPSSPSSVCGGTLSFSAVNPAPPSDAFATLTFSGGSLTAGETCSIDVDIELADDQAKGFYTLTTSEVAGVVSATNVTGDTASASFEVNAGIAEISLTKTFDEDAVFPGNSVGMTFALSNNSPDTDASAINFADDLDAFLSGVILSSVDSNDCSATVGGTGTGSISVSDVSLAYGESCEIGVTIGIPAGATPNTYTNTTSIVNATADGGTAQDVPGSVASADLAVAAVDFDFAFLTDYVLPGDTARAQYTFTNDGATDAAITFISTSFSPLDSGATLDPVYGDTCGGTMTPSGSFMSYTGGTIPANGTCTFFLPVDVPASASYGNVPITTSTLIFTNGAAGVVAAKSDDIDVGGPLDGGAVLTLAKTFSDDAVEVGTATTVTFDIVNTVGEYADDVAFSDDLDAFRSGTLLTSVVSDTCDGTPAGIATGTFSYTGGEIVEGGSCQIVITITPATGGTFGTFTNTTSDVTATMLTAPISGAAASDDIDIRSDVVPTFTKAFTPSTANQNSTVTVTYDISIPAGGANLSDMNFDDDFGSLLTGTTIATLPADGSCGGASFVGTGTGTFSMRGAALDVGESCQFAATFNVVTPTAATYTSTSSNLLNGTDLQTTGASATLTVNPPPPDLAKAFAPATVSEGETSTLTFTIDASAYTQSITGLAFTDTLPSGLVVETPSVTANSCGGTLTATAGSGSITLSGGTVAAASTCIISVDVVSTSASSYVNTTSVLSSDFGDGASATDTLTVTAAPVLGFTQSFGTDPIEEGGVSTLTYAITSTAFLDASSVAFTDTLTANLTVADPSNLTSDCGGTPTATGSTISLTGGSVSAMGSCSISVDITSVVDGSYTNTSGNLTSSLGNSGTSSDGLVVDPAPVLGFSQSFATDPILEGGVSTLTYQIVNTALIDATSIDFTDALTSGLTVADPSNLTNDCGGTPTASGSTISLTGGTLATASTCTLSVDVTSITAGNYSNTSGDLTSSLGNSGTSDDMIVVNAPPVPPMSKTYDPSTVSQGEITTVSIVIDNSAAILDVTSVVLTDTFPSSMEIAATPNVTLSDHCVGGTLSAAAGATEVTWTSGTITGGESCTITYDVFGLDVGDLDNTATLTSSLGNTFANATLTVEAAPVPVLTHAFDPNSIEQGGASTLTVTIDNSAAFIEASSLGLSGDLSAALEILSDGAPYTTTNTCGGSLLAPHTGTRFQLSGGTVAAGGSCSLSVVATGEVVGDFTNTLSASTSSNGASVIPAAADLEVTEVLTADVIFEIATDFDGDYVFTSATPELGFTIAALNGEGSEGPIELPAGSYSTNVATPSGVAITAISCNDDDSTGVSTTGDISLELAAREVVTCTVTSIETLQKTVDTIHSFLHRRGGMILSNQPDRSRRLDRLNSGGTGGQSLNFAQGDIFSMLPVDIDPLSFDQDNFNISTSLKDVQIAHAMALMAHDGVDDSIYLENNRWDLWFEGSYQKFTAAEDTEGYFGIAYVGADYVFSRDFLVGVVLQFDQMEESSDIDGTLVSGRGWMAGPYVTARLKDNLIFDGRLAYGESVNDISPFGTYTDTFDTTRFLIDANLSGQFKTENGWNVSPNVALSYLQEHQKSYVDGLGVTIPAQKLKMGQLRVGPNFSKRFTQADGSSFEPFFSLDGIYTFSTADDIVSDEASTETEGLRGRLEAGFTTTNEHGAKFQLKANYDGIGLSDYESYGVSLKLTVPLQ